MQQQFDALSSTVATAGAMPNTSAAAASAAPPAPAGLDTHADIQIAELRRRAVELGSKAEKQLLSRNGLPGIAKMA